MESTRKRGRPPKASVTKQVHGQQILTYETNIGKGKNVSTVSSDKKGTSTGKGVNSTVETMSGKEMEKCIEVIMKKVRLELAETIKEVTGSMMRGMEEIKSEIISKWEESEERRKEEMGVIEEKVVKLEEGERVLSKRLAAIESERDKTEKMKRKKNIIIKGAVWAEGDSKREVEELLKKKIGINVVIVNARVLGGRKEGSTDKRTVLAEVKDMESKIEIMRKKKDLPRGVYIDDDLTQKKGIYNRRREDLQKKEGKKEIK